MYDAIVVGARCSGSPAALLLAKKGYKVLLIDKSTFPSDKQLSTHYLFPTAIAALKRFGLLNKLERSNCPAVGEILIDWGLDHFYASTPAYDGISVGYGPRRFCLDEILLNGAIEAGVEFREGVTVVDLITHDGQVVGVKCQGKDHHSTFEEKARIVIGADGVFSQIANKVNAEKYNERPTKSGVYFSYWKNVNTKAGLCMYLRPKRLLATVRTNDDLTLIANYFPVEEFSTFRENIESNFMDDWRRFVPEMYENIINGERAETWKGTNYQPNFFRKPYGPGWVLVGDAALHHDSINPSGISYAFVNTEKTVEAIDEVLSGKKSFHEAMAEFEKWRELRWMPHYEYLTSFAEINPPDSNTLELLNIMKQHPKVAKEYMGFVSGNPNYYYFFSEDNLSEIFAKYGNNQQESTHSKKNKKTERSSHLAH